MIKKIISFVFLSLTISLLHSCIFFNEYDYKEHLMTSGDFKYIEGRFPSDKGYVYLIELSEEGLKKDTIVVPVEIDGKPVKGLGYSGRNEPTETHAYFKLFGIKRIYIPAEKNGRKNQIVIQGYSINNQLAIFMPNVHDATIKKDETSLYEGICLKCKKNDVDYVNNGMSAYPANTLYYINSDVYFVDDCDGTIVNVIPPNPIKEGYKFDGWYKDNEFNEKWNFETDVVPPKQYDENGNYIYQEISIYAKFTYIGE